MLTLRKDGFVESAFSMMQGIKSKLRSPHNTPEHNLRWGLAKASAFDELVGEKQPQSSH